MQDTFAEALKVIWQTVLGIAFAGMLASIGMRQVTLHTQINEVWGRKDLPTGHQRRQLHTSRTDDFSVRVISHNGGQEAFFTTSQ